MLTRKVSPDLLCLDRTQSPDLVGVGGDVDLCSAGRGGQKLGVVGSTQTRSGIPALVDDY
jgi:hypothetical protein